MSAKTDYSTTLKRMISWPGILLTVYAVFCVLISVGEVFHTLLLAPFLAAYYFTWRNKGIAGLLFILWFIGVCCAECVVPPHQQGSGPWGAFPILILGIVFIIRHAYAKVFQVEDAPRLGRREEWTTKRNRQNG